jgi:hypothetical protein
MKTPSPIKRLSVVGAVNTYNQQSATNISDIFESQVLSIRGFLFLLNWVVTTRSNQSHPGSRQRVTAVFSPDEWQSAIFRQKHKLMETQKGGHRRSPIRNLGESLWTLDQ